MPSYDYRCKECGDFIVEQPITAEMLTYCPSCGQPVKRIIGKNINVLYKTQGFYCTDKAGSNNCSSCG